MQKTFQQEICKKGNDKTNSIVSLKSADISGDFKQLGIDKASNSHEPDPPLLSNHTKLSPS